jgi:hypothetical protein
MAFQFDVERLLEGNLRAGDRDGAKALAEQ